VALLKVLVDGESVAPEVMGERASMAVWWCAGVDASGDGERAPWDWDGVFAAAMPFVEDLGNGVDASAGRKATRIFFSWMEDLFVCSMWAHCLDGWC